MRNNLVAQRYAKAVLMNIKAAEYDDLRKDIKFLLAAFQKDQSYIKVLDSPIYHLNDRLQAALEITQELSKQKLWESLFKILIKKHRFSLIDNILKALDKFILESKNQVHLELILACKHPKSIIEKIEEKIKDILKKDLEIEMKIDAEILGGFVARTENFLIDGSIKHNLVRLININKI